MRADVAAVAQDRRRNCDIAGDAACPDEDDDDDVNEAKVWILSISMELQQSSRIEVRRCDDNLNNWFAVGEVNSDRKNDETCSQNCIRYYSTQTQKHRAGEDPTLFHDSRTCSIADRVTTWNERMRMLERIKASPPT
jgi:hypothetical protein